jgi:adenylosuccinate synthase
MAEKGHEFGATTGRPRRCGWFDAVAMRRSAQINSLSGLCITKLDVLDGIEKLKIGVGYRYQGELRNTPPVGADAFSECEVIYEEMPGWSEPTAGIRDYDQLPAGAKGYLKRLEALCEVPIDIISTGPDRVETIVIRDPFG